MLNNAPIREPKPGEIIRVRHGGRTAYVTVEATPGDQCRKCALLGLKRCGGVDCAAESRSDKKNVIFKPVKTFGRNTP